MRLVFNNRPNKLTFLDVVVGQGATVLKLLSGKNQSLLVRGDACKEVSLAKRV